MSNTLGWGGEGVIASAPFRTEQYLGHPFPSRRAAGRRGVPSRRGGRGRASRRSPPSPIPPPPVIVITLFWFVSFLCLVLYEVFFYLAPAASAGWWFWANAAAPARFRNKNGFSEAVPAPLGLMRRGRGPGGGQSWHREPSPSLRRGLRQGLLRLQGRTPSPPPRAEGSTEGPGCAASSALRGSQPRSGPARPRVPLPSRSPLLAGSRRRLCPSRSLPGLPKRRRVSSPRRG